MSRFTGESPTERQSRLLDEMLDRWFAVAQPLRLCLWIVSLYLALPVWLYFEVKAWRLWIRMRGRGFDNYTSPPIRLPMPAFNIIDALVSVQPMALPTAQIFHIQYQMGKDEPEPQTRQAAGWLWGFELGPRQNVLRWATIPGTKGVLR